MRGIHFGSQITHLEVSTKTNHPLNRTLVISYTNQSAWSQILLSDYFTESSINTNSWNIILPFKGVMIYDWTGHYVVSGASVTNGSLLLTGAGQISSKQSFQYPYTFSGVFNGQIRPSIWIRGTNNLFNSNYGHPTGYDIQFGFNSPSEWSDGQCQIIEQ
jgi:hypothetical protein